MRVLKSKDIEKARVQESVYSWKKYTHLDEGEYNKGNCSKQ